MKNWLFIIITSLLFISSGVLGYFVYDEYNAIQELSSNLADTQANLKNALGTIDFLNETIISKDIEINELNTEVTNLLNEKGQLKTELKEKTKELTVSKSEIEELSTITKKQSEKIQTLIETQRSLHEEGKLIVDEYGGTLVLYDTPEVYSLMSPVFNEVKQDRLDYSKLGIPFFYFKDEEKKTEGGLLLGTYSSLYNYIFIYKGGDKRTVYHEIGHIIYRKFFLENSNNLKVWQDMYKQLKDLDLLSSEYAKTNDIEGFSEEYAAYKLSLEQPPAVVSLMSQIEAFLR